jgi:hypothetical protein
MTINVDKICYPVVENLAHLNSTHRQDRIQLHILQLVCQRRMFNSVFMFVVSEVSKDRYTAAGVDKVITVSGV